MGDPFVRKWVEQSAGHKRSEIGNLARIQYFFWPTPVLSITSFEMMGYPDSIVLVKCNLNSLVVF